MRMCHRWIQEGTTHRRGQSNPTHCPTDRDDRNIVYMSVLNQAATSQTISKQNQSVTHHLLSTHTIRRHLVESEFKTRHEGEQLQDHFISRLEPQLLDYVEVQHPQTTSNFLQIIEKYEERFLNRWIRNPNANNRFLNRNRQENWRETRGYNRFSDNSRPQREFSRFEGQGVGDNRRLGTGRRSGQSDHRFHKQGGRRGGSRNGDFKRQNDQNRHLNF
ncbi:uncharacterized protein TNCV_4926151 [Trichonephila clavipes]|nr:uncharacterized protein TNCV_4926151 [Trichonephila clavipes]